MTVHIITDSTNDLPQRFIDEHNITVVPAYVNIGTDSYRDNIDIDRTEFYDKLPTYEPYPTTSACTPGELAAAYEKATAAGATEILSIHVSGTLSSITNSAANGRDLGDFAPVTIYDSQQLSMGLGFQVLAAARAAQAGAHADSIVAMLDQLRPRIKTYCMLDSMEALRRSGRVNWVAAGIGRLLKIKQIVLAYKGEVTAHRRTRTTHKGLLQMVDIVKNEVGRVERYALLNSNVPDLVDELHQRVKPHMPTDVQPIHTIACPAIGVHVGAGAIGMVCVER